jgi:hypothetical protein
MIDLRNPERIAALKREYKRVMGRDTKLDDDQIAIAIGCGWRDVHILEMMDAHDNE